MKYKVATRVYDLNANPAKASRPLVSYTTPVSIEEAHNTLHTVRVVFAQHGLPLDIWLVPSEV